MHEGQVGERGTTVELLRLGGRYAELQRMQGAVLDEKDTENEEL